VRRSAAQIRKLLTSGLIKINKIGIGTTCVVELIVVPDQGKVLNGGNQMQITIFRNQVYERLSRSGTCGATRNQESRPITQTQK